MAGTMAAWNEVLAEVQKTRTPQGQFDLDGVRRSKLRAVAAHTGRPLIVYAADFLNAAKAASAEMSVDWSDKEGFVEALNDLSGDQVDVLLHSPGGMAEAAESIVAILRERFREVRFIVPNIAKSAATMLALSGDEILMNEASELGPIDPQFTFRRGDGTVFVAPAQAIIDQFDDAESRISKDPTLLAPWLPILQQYGPSLYRQAKNAIDLSTAYVKEWLTKYMFRGDKDAREKAVAIAAYLSDHNKFKSHAKRIGLSDIMGTKPLNELKVIDMRKDPQLHSLVWSLYHAITITFSMTGAFKLFENSTDRALVRIVQQVLVAAPAQGPPAKEEPQPQSADNPSG